jgi:hypothetical protein
MDDALLVGQKPAEDLAGFRRERGLEPGVEPEGPAVMRRLLIEGP